MNKDLEKEILGLKRQVNALTMILKSKESTIAKLGRDLLTAKDNSLDSEREANRILTNELEKALEEFPDRTEDKIQRVLNAALLAYHLPDAGGYNDGPAIEDIYEEFDDAIEAWTGIIKESDPNIWQGLEETRTKLAGFYKEIP